MRTKSQIKGTAKVIFGGKIQISFATHKKTKNPCLLFCELPASKKSGEYITDEELKALNENPSVVFEFNDTHSIEVLRAGLYMVEEDLRRKYYEQNQNRKKQRESAKQNQEQ